VQPWIFGAGAVAVAVFVALFATQSRHDLLHDALPVLLAPFALWMVFSERYELTLGVLLIYLGCVDGVVKLASGSTLATLGRDVLLYSIVVGAVARMIIRKTPITIPRFTGFVVAWVAVCVIQLANPADISVLHAVASLRPHLEFVPLFFFGYVVLRSERRLSLFFLLLLIVAAVNGIVGLIQSGMSPATLASWGPGYAHLELGNGVVVARTFVNAAGQAEVRPPGLGGADGFGGMLGLIALPCGVALLTNWRHKLRLTWLVIPATGLAIVAVVTSEARLAVVGTIVALVVFLALTVTSRRGVIALILTLSLGLGGYLVISAVEVAPSGSRYTSISPSEVLNTSLTSRQSSLALIPKYLHIYPLGAGIGSTGPAAFTDVGGSTFQKGINGETEFTFLLAETGIPGLAVMLAFTLAMLTLGFRLRRIAIPRLQCSLMALLAVLVALTVAWFIAPMTSDSPTAPFIWLSGGCLVYWYQQVRSGRVPVRPRTVRGALG
jgi:hypothetical protein